MKKVLRETGQIIRFNFKNLVLFQMGYRLLAAAVYLQLLNVGMRFSMKRAGYSYLSAENAGRFFLSPWTIPVLTVLVLTGLVFFMTEAGGLIAAYEGAEYSLKMSSVQILIQGIKYTIDQMRRKNFRLLWVTAADFFLMNFFYLYRTLTHVKPLNFVIEELSAYPLAGVVIFLVICLCVAAVIPSYFVFHECMTEQKGYNDGKAYSRQLLKGRYFRIIVRVVCPQILLVVSAVAVYVIWVVMVAVFAILFVRRDLETAFLLRASDWGEWFVMAGASGAASLLYFGDLTVQYYRYGRNKIGRQHFFDTGRAVFSRKSGVAVLAATGIFGGMGLIDSAVNGSFLASSIVVQTEITAHRGGSRTAPENTLAAVEAAIEEMADWAEIDVQETLDGVVVLCHDTNLMRVCNVNQAVSELTWEELGELDAGSWFSPEYAGEKIPRLGDIMEYAKGKIRLNIEIKDLGKDSPLPGKVRELVEQYEMEEQCIVTCTNLNYLIQIKEENPQIRTGYIVAAAYGNQYMNEEVDVISIRSGFVTGELIQKAHEAGKSVHAWTVNDRKELERMRVLGVDNVITDMPVLAREILYREEEAEDLLHYLRMMLG